MLHTEQLAAFAATLYVPLAQAVHSRFVVVVPATLTDCPGAQVDQLTQAVAGLSSWSQVPGAHATFGAAAPAQ